MSTEVQTIARSPREAGSLAVKLAKARREMIECYERHQGLSPQEAVARIRELDTDQYAQLVLQKPPRETSWDDMNALAAVDPELPAERWADMVDEARADLETGHRAAECVEFGSDCWERAQFIAFREQLAAEWKPQTGIELTLIDSMAQSLTMKERWLKRSIAVDSIEQSKGSSDKFQLPLASVYQVIEQALAAAERFDRMFSRSLRQLRDLRRYAPTVVVKNAGQVNVANQQVNVSDSSDGDKE